jgi:uncharacterized protein YqgC (DUF456 family)
MTGDILLSILGGISMLAGIIGCIVPVLPGPVMCLAGLFILQLTTAHPFTAGLLIVYAVLTLIVSLLDYAIPVYGTKKLKGSKYGIWGSAAGLLLGAIFFFPVGIIAGPVAGAFAGELLSGKSVSKAFKSAWGSFLGFLAGTAVKLALSFAMAYHFAVALYTLFSG